MAHDAHLFFSIAALTQRVEKILKTAQIQGKKLFLVETYPDQPKKLFYKILFTDELSEKAHFKADGKTYPFFDLFTAIVKRTGKHIQQGTLLCNIPCFPPSLANHEICHKILEISLLSKISVDPMTSK